MYNWNPLVANVIHLAAQYKLNTIPIEATEIPSGSSDISVKKPQNLEGAKNAYSMKDNFEFSWNERNEKSINLIDESENYQLLNNL